MINVLPLAILTLACFAYGIYAIRSIVFNDPAPLSVECLGVALDLSKRFVLSNTESADAARIDYPQGRGLLPDTLGEISYVRSSESFALKTSDQITKEKVNNENPFYAFVRNSNVGWFGRYRFFDANEVIPADILQSGIIFNSPAGDRKSRVALRTRNFGNRTYLLATTEGVGTKYLLEAGRPNRISVICNQGIDSQETRIYQFKNTTDERCNYTIEVISRGAFTYAFKVIDQNGRAITDGNEDTETFEVGSYLFKISTAHSLWDISVLAAGMLVLIAFQGFFLWHLSKSKSRPVQATIVLRVLLNCLVFLSIPLYVIALTITHSRLLYLVLIILLNLSYFLPIDVLHRTGGRLIITGLSAPLIRVVVLGLLAGLPIFVRIFSANESLFGVPVLHVQKVAILGLIFVTFDIIKNSWLRLATILIYALILSLLSSDLGSFLYTFLAFLLIWYVRKAISIRLLGTVGLVAMFALFATYQLSKGEIAGGKFYRFIAPYSSPDSDYLSRANEADRESFAHLNLIQKNLWNGTVPEMSSLVVPASMRSTCFSDFAFFWSLAYGKLTFAALFLCVVGWLLYELTFLLVLSIRPIRINEKRSYLLPATRESEFIRFLVALTIVTFVYPVLSNLLLVPLTGQSLPCLSISNVEIGFLIILLVSLTAIFTNPLYVQPADSRVTETYGDVSWDLRMAFVFFAFLFLAALSFRLLWIYNLPEEYRWRKPVVEDEAVANDLNVSEKFELLRAAGTLVGKDELTAIDSKKKPYLRNLFSYYFTGRPYRQIKPENVEFELTNGRLLQRMNVAESFSRRPRQVSGEHSPFGRVFASDQLVNGKLRTVYTNNYYSSIPTDAKTINPDLTAELTKQLDDHLAKIGEDSNIGAVLIVDNTTGGIVANSSYPLLTETNSSYVHYNIGSLKKLVVAYVALAVDQNYKNRSYNNKSYSDFIKWSDDLYAASLLKDLMLNHEQRFSDILKEDLNMPLVSQSQDAYFDKKPGTASYSRPFNKKNEIFRYSIGQQKPYRFSDVVEWYARIASGRKVVLNYSGGSQPEAKLSMGEDQLEFFWDALSGVLSGTAAGIGDELVRNGRNRADFIAKTGTAESESGTYNSSSSVIIANRRYTIGIMLKGKIPSNRYNLAAKDLMVNVVPTLRKYRIL